MTAAEDCVCDPGAGVFMSGCTQHLPSGEFTPARLRRVEQERDTAIKAAEICERALDRVSSLHMKAEQERDEARACWSAAERDLTAVRTERDLARTELESARTELERLRDQLVAATNTHRTEGEPT